MDCKEYFTQILWRELRILQIFLISLQKLAESQLHLEIPLWNLAIISYLTTAPHIDTRLGTFCKDGYCKWSTNHLYSSLSPEFNIAEYVFNKMKTVLRREEFGRLLRENAHVAIYEALGLVTTEGMFGFYNFIL